MLDFTQKKFLAQPFERQHKKCAEILHLLYMKWARSEKWNMEWERYLQFLEWMQEEHPSMPISIKTIADIYHIHLQKALISKREHSLLPQIHKGDRSQGEERWAIAIYLDGLRSAHNIGSIIRTTEAFSLGTLYFSETTPDISHKQVKNTAMGSAQWIAWARGVELASLPRPLIALETVNEAISLYEFIFPETFTLIVGNEEYGCSDKALSLSDYVIQIPLRGRKNSLNVANAFAITAGEIRRQKGTCSKKIEKKQN